MRENERMGGCLLLLLAALLIGFLSVGGYAIYTQQNVHITQPLRRQNINNDADRRIQIEQQYRQLASDFNTVVQSIPSDKAAVAAYVAAHGAPSTYTYFDSQAYNELEATLDGDYRAAQRIANDYNALLTNADTGQFKPADLPDHLDAPTR